MGSPRVTYYIDICYRRTKDNLRRLAAAGLGTANLIRPEDLHETVRERQERISGKMKSYLDGVNDAKRAMIDQTMEMTGGNHQEAAKLLDITLSYFYRLIRTLYVKRDT